MRLLFLLVVFSVSFTNVITQDPPPVFDLPPPPPLDGPVTDTGNEHTERDIAVNSANNDSFVTKDIVNNTDKADPAQIIESVSATNDLIISTSDTNSEGNLTSEASNEQINRNVSTDTNLSFDTLSNKSSIISDASENALSNFTDSFARDISLSDINSLTDSTNNLTDILNESLASDAANGTNILTDVIIQNVTPQNQSFNALNESTDQILPQTDGKNSLTLSLDGIIDVKNIDQVPSSIDLPPSSVDLPPPPSFGFDPEIQQGLGSSEVGSNFSDNSHIDINTAVATEANDTRTGNKTFIERLDITIDSDTGNVTVDHTPVQTITDESAQRNPADVPPAPVPIDLPPPPIERPSIDFIETQGSTTIEINDLFAELGSLDKSSPPMNMTLPETTTAGMILIYPDITIDAPRIDTTTETPIDMFETPSEFPHYATTTSSPMTTEPELRKHIPETAEQLPSMDHPPPIFSGGSRPSVYTDQYGPHDGNFPFVETTTKRIKTVTNEAPPPPIIVPTYSDRQTNWQSIATTISPYSWKTTTTPLHPRHMNVAELAAYALKMTNKQKKLSNEPSRGIHVFFPSGQKITTTQKPSTNKPVYIHQNIEPQKDLRSNAFMEYLRKRYGSSNPTIAQRPVSNQFRKAGVQHKFYDAQYLLSHLPETTTLKPTIDSNYLRSHFGIGYSKPASQTLYMTTLKPRTSTRHFFDSQYLLTHLDELKPAKSPLESNLPPTKQMTRVSEFLPQLTGSQNKNNAQSEPKTWMNDISVKRKTVPQINSEQTLGKSVLKEQRQGQVETRPLNFHSDLQPQSIISYNVNPKPNKQFTGFTTANFKPVVYGNNPVQRAKTSSGLTLRERFNRKWYHPEKNTSGTKQLQTKTSTTNQHPIRNINIRFDEVTNNKQLNTAPHSTVNIQLNEISAGSNINQALQNSARNRDLLIQRSSIELQKKIIKQQEEKLRQQQQKLQEQEAMLRLQREQGNKQIYQIEIQQNNQTPTPEQERLRLLRLQQSQNRNLLLLQQQQQRNKEQERLHRLRHQSEEKQKVTREQQERDRLQLLQQQQQQLQQQEQYNQQLLLRQKEQKRALLLQQKQRQFHLDQQARERPLQQQLQQQQKLQLERQKELELLRRQQIDRQNNPFPLATRIGHSETLQSNEISTRQLQHTYQPNVQLSSIQIFRAPAMLRRRKNRERKESIPQSSQTHWRAPTDLRNLHGHLSVPYKINYLPEVQATQTTTTPGVYVATTNVPTVYMETIRSTTMRPTTSSPRPTLPATADPNPPPIFDTKVRLTFMPMPKIDPTTRAPRSAANVSGWDGGKGEKTLTNTHKDERCRGCVFVNDRCLLPDPVHCHFYIECVKHGASVRAFSRECALGSFFDRKSFLCVDPKNADCPTDRCRVPGTKWYAIHGHCKHYWSCGSREGGGVYAQSECCPEMGGFVEPVGCVENPNCTDTCSSTIIKDGPTGCQLRKTATPTVYYDGNAKIERPCATGTLFNERACTCVQDVSFERSETKPGDLTNCSCSNETSCSCGGAMQATAKATSCLPMLALTFDGGKMEDSSNTKQHIGVDGVSATQEGEALYNGGGRLVLWRYANLMFPIVYAIRFRFYSTTPSPRKQIIFSNCDTKGGQQPSLEISIDTLYNEVVFNIDTYEGPSKRFTIIYQPSKWTNVDFIYDGERIVGSVDRRARNIIASGGIETRPHPVGIGTCKGKDGFKGLLDDVFIYEDCIPDDMYGIFMSVLE